MLCDINDADFLQNRSLKFPDYQPDKRRPPAYRRRLLQASYYLPIIVDMVWAINCALAPKITCIPLSPTNTTPRAPSPFSPSRSTASLFATSRRRRVMQEPTE